MGLIAKLVNLKEMFMIKFYLHMLRRMMMNIVISNHLDFTIISVRVSLAICSRILVNLGHLIDADLIPVMDFVSSQPWKKSSEFIYPIFLVSRLSKTL
jgi:tRNA uridine 5-carbamoylmethylation protein Kti12